MNFKYGKQVIRLKDIIKSQQAFVLPNFNSGYGVKTTHCY